MAALFIILQAIALAFCKAIHDDITIDLFQAYINGSKQQQQKLQRQWHFAGWLVPVIAIMALFFNLAAPTNQVAIIAGFLLYASTVWLVFNVTLNLIRNQPANHLGSNDIDKLLAWASRKTKLQPVALQAIVITLTLILFIWLNYF